MAIRTETHDRTLVVTIDRPEARNAVDQVTATELYETFRSFDVDDTLDVAILTGADGNFCSGADLKAVAEGRGNRIEDQPAEEILGSQGPMGPTRLALSKPVIAAVEGYAVAGGLELAVWCDLRVMARDATFGVYCRRFGVPLVDGGAVRLPRLIGHSVATDLILTGRSVASDEALAIGLANRVVEPGEALAASLELAAEIGAFPQTCLRNDRAASIEQWSLRIEDALRVETLRGLETIEAPDTVEGAMRFLSGDY